MATMNDLELQYYSEALAGTLPGSELPTDPEFDSVKTGLIISDDYNILRSKDGTVLQDEHGDYAYWDRNQGLQLKGQGSVNPKISADDTVEVTSPGFEVKDLHGNTILSDWLVRDLQKETPYRDIESIQSGLTSQIANESSQLRAVTKLTSALYSHGEPSSGKISISTQDKKLGYLPPAESDGYGVLYFDYVRGNVNMVLLKWEAEDGKVYEGVVSESTWHKWGTTSSFATQEESQLLAGIAGGELFVNEIQVG